MDRTRTWKNVELNKADAEFLKTTLKLFSIRYEPSSCGDLIHFEILCNDAETELIDAFLSGLK